MESVERRNVDKLKHRVLEQVFGAIATTIFVGFVGWLAGFVDMKRDVLEQGKSLVKMEVSLGIAQKDINELKMDGFKADATLDKRVTVMESQHAEILRTLPNKFR